MAPDYRAFRASLAVQGPRCSRSCLRHSRRFCGERPGTRPSPGLLPDAQIPDLASRGRQEGENRSPLAFRSTARPHHRSWRSDPPGGRPTGGRDFRGCQPHPALRQDPQSPQGAPANGDQRGPWSLRQPGLLLQAWRLQRTRMCRPAQVRGAARLPTTCAAHRWAPQTHSSVHVPTADLPHGHVLHRVRALRHTLGP